MTIQRKQKIFNIRKQWKFGHIINERMETLENNEDEENKKQIRKKIKTVEVMKAK